MTGSSELTHANGLASGPVQAEETLESFPRELKVVSLCLALITQRSSFNKLVNDVYLFMKDRYFIGEVLEACLEGKSWYNCTILQVRGPTEQEIKDYQDSGVGSAEDYQIFPPACLYHYQVEKFCSYNDINRVFEASASHVRRKKRLITKGKLNLFLKQCLSLNSFGIWSIQDSVQESLGINDVKFTDIFVGQPPKFPKRYEKIAKKPKKDSPDQNARNGIVVKKESVKKSKHAVKSPCELNINSFNSNESSDADDFKNSSWQTCVTDLNSSVSPQKITAGKSSKSEQKHSTKIVKKVKKKGNSEDRQKLDQSVKRKYATWRGLTWEERQKIKEKKKKRALMEKLKKREEKMKAKAKREEEKLQMAMLLKGRNKTREDLECEDLKPMPVPREVKCSYLPNELFGDFMVILEFFQSFQTLVDMKRYFPRGVTFNHLENALMDSNVDGPLCNIIIYLLSTLFKMKDDNEILESDSPAIDFENEEIAGDTDVAENARLAAVEYANRLYQGALASETLNHLTVTEVLRLHLSCGSRRAELTSQNQRDILTDPGDPATVLCTKYPHIVRELSSFHVCEMPLQDKIIILVCLIDQILTCGHVREELDERGEQLKQVKLEIRAYKAAEVKRNKEAHAQRIKEKREAKQKLKEGDTSQSSVAPEPDVQAKLDVENLPFEKELRSNERKKPDLEEKISRLRHLSMNFNLFPIGKDRAHRRYWVFSSLPGLYVENNPFEIGPCLSQATPREVKSPNHAHSSKEAKSPVRKNAQNKSPVKSPVKKESSDGFIRVNSVKLESGERESVSTEMLLCTSSDGCPVHGQTVPRVRWSYFACQDDVNLLIESLNKCGLRESELRKILIRDEQWLKDIVDQCPMDIVNSLETENEQKPASSSSRYRYLNCPPGTPPSCLMELVLREHVLDLESRITARCMGSLEVKDAAKWREAIENGEYDKQCDKLVWGFSNDLVDNDELKPFNNESVNTRIACESVSAVDDRFIAQSSVQDETQSSVLKRNSPVKSRDVPGRVLEEKNGENRRSSCYDLNNKSQGEVGKKNVEIISKVNDELSRSCTIKNLASSILQLAQAVDVIYLRNPLVDDDDDEDQKIVDLKRWEVSLMNSTSFSQLFLHISLLDFSIHWSKSVLNTRCALCRRRGDGENMLLCDGCNRGHHLYCLKPKLTKVPEGDWYCMKCKPDQKQEPSEKKRKSTSESATKEYEKRPSKSRKIMHNDVCNDCGLKYNLILCSSCPLAYHTVCVSPALKEVPEGMWTCPECNMGESTTEEKENESTSRRSSRRKSGTSDFSLNNSVLQDLLSDVMCHRDAWPFLQPVRKAEAPRYHIIIKKPMDLGTMKYKLNRAQYKNNSEFLADALLIFENCRMYNEDDTEVYKCGSRLSQYFKKRCKELSLDLRD